MVIVLNSKLGFTKQNHVSGHVIIATEFRSMSEYLCIKLPLLCHLLLYRTKTQVQDLHQQFVQCFPTPEKFDIFGSIIKGGRIIKRALLLKGALEATTAKFQEFLLQAQVATYTSAFKFILESGKSRS